ncbi:hypothetical protein SO802_001356 [Lithocarpus litseifolius]|uniref:Uncharacterized protein n=1 Tax=Lithocarpus litseifolius TaxID=425828 RepID=A0AAW2DU62_9ROSI
MLGWEAEFCSEDFEILGAVMHEDISNFGSILLQLSDLLLGKKIWEYIFLTEQDPYTYTEVIRHTNSIGNIQNMRDLPYYSHWEHTKHA